QDDSRELLDALNDGDLREGAPEQRRRRRSHRLGGRQRDRAAHRPVRATQRRDDPDERTDDERGGTGSEKQERETKELRVEARRIPSEPIARRRAEQDADDSDREHELEIVNRSEERRVGKGWMEGRTG